MLLACLAKRPNARPNSAETLAKLLLDCPEAGTWTQHAARAWWQSNATVLQQEGIPVSSRANSPFSETVAVNLDDRLGLSPPLEPPPAEPPQANLARRAMTRNTTTSRHYAAPREGVSPHEVEQLAHRQRTATPSWPKNIRVLTLSRVWGVVAPR